MLMTLGLVLLFWSVLAEGLRRLLPARAAARSAGGLTDALSCEGADCSDDSPYTGVLPIAPTPFADNGDVDLDGSAACSTA